MVLQWETGDLSKSSNKTKQNKKQAIMCVKISTPQTAVPSTQSTPNRAIWEQVAKAAGTFCEGWQSLPSCGLDRGPVSRNNYEMWHILVQARCHALWIKTEAPIFTCYTCKKKFLLIPTVGWLQRQSPQHVTAGRLVWYNACGKQLTKGTKMGINPQPKVGTLSWVNNAK